MSTRWVAARPAFRSPPDQRCWKCGALFSMKAVTPSRKSSVRNASSIDRPMRLVNHPLRYDGAIPPVCRPPPALGQLSLEILRELGYSQNKVQEMAAGGAVRPPPKHP